MTTATPIRCGWVNLHDTLYVAYHDQEWGRPVHDDQIHFEYLLLEAAQAGLSWRTVLHKREGYRLLFDQFDPAKICQYDSKKVASLCQDKRIIRHRGKIETAIENAKLFLDIQQQYDSFDTYIWSFTEGNTMLGNCRTASDYVAHTPLSDTISKDLKQKGMRFVGSTIIYAYLQAVGIVNDHEIDCAYR